MDNCELYLLWIPNEGWGVFDSVSCPDPGAFPNWMYKCYQFDKTHRKIVYDSLMDVRSRFIKEGIIPSRDKEIFPELSDLLE